MVDHVIRPAGELRAQVLALGGDAGWTGVEVALARHVAAECDEQAGAEAELFRAEEGRHDYVAAVPEATVRSQAHTLSQPVRHQHLLRLGQPQLPGNAGVLDRREG